jgi:1-aminocyclopropane-1-carboxylate deaminase
LQIPSVRIQRLEDNGRVVIDVLRLDEIDPLTGGNKWYKLKYNLLEAMTQGKSTIVTAGGASSNHIAATAEACRRSGLRSIGIIRGGEYETHTMGNARAAGMEVFSLGRKAFTEGLAGGFGELLAHLNGDYHYIPEGGSNCEGMKGCMEMIAGGHGYDVVMCACGTGTTFAGLAASAGDSCVVIGISALKGSNLLPDHVKKILKRCGKNEVSVVGNEGLNGKATTNCISNAYASSGYARPDPEVLEFKTEFERRHRVPLDYIYTARLFYAVSDLSSRGVLDGRRVLVVHSGGLQGNRAFEDRYHLTPSR